MHLPFITPYLTTAQIRLFGLVVAGSIVINAIIWWLTLTVFPLDSPATILHYTIDVGVDFIGEGKQITSLPIMGLAIIVFNTIMGVALLRADQRASWLLWSVMPPIQLALLLAFYLLREVNL